MYLRTIQRRNRDGSVVRYVQLAHNRRKGTSTQAEVLVSLGREDRLDLEGLRRLGGPVGRFPGGPPGPAGGQPPPRWRGLGAGGGVLPADRGDVAAGWAVAAAGDRRSVGWGAGWAAVFDRGGAGAVRAGRRAGSRAGLQAGHRGVGGPGRGDPWAGADGQGSGVPGDGPAGGGR